MDLLAFNVIFLSTDKDLRFICFAITAKIIVSSVFHAFLRTQLVKVKGTFIGEVPPIESWSWVFAPYIVVTALGWNRDGINGLHLTAVTQLNAQKYHEEESVHGNGKA